MKFILTTLSILVFFHVKGQTIAGEENPCPDQIYEYVFSGTICGDISWEALDGTIIGTTSNSVKVQWKNVVNNNGRWKVRANYTAVKFDGSCGSGTFLDKPVKVKATTALNISGDLAVPCGFRGTKTYSIQVLNPDYPANSYRWTTNTGCSGTSNTGTINLTVNNDNAGWIEVSGYNTVCQTYGPSKRVNITRSAASNVLVSGPSTFCSNATYSLTNVPASSTIQWNATGPISISGSTSGASVNVIKTGDGIGYVSATITTPCGPFTTTTREVIVGASAPAAIHGQSTMSGSGAYDYSVDPIPGATSYQWAVSGGLTIQNQGKSSIIIRTPSLPPNYVSNNIAIKVKVISACGESAYFTRYVTLKGGTGPIN